MYIISSPSERKVLVEHILTAAAAREDLGSACWTVSSVFSRLGNVMKLRNFLS